MSGRAGNAALLSARLARARRRRAAMSVLEWAVMLAVLFAILFPIAWMVLTAFKQPADVFRLSLGPSRPRSTISARCSATNGMSAPRSLHSAGDLLSARSGSPYRCAVLAAYAFSRLRFFGRRLIFQWLLITQFIPAVVVVLPFYLLFRNLGLLDTYIALIVVNLSVVVPYAIWTMKGFIDAVPMDTEEAALMDGAGRLRLLWDVIVPMARPGILTAAIFCFILTWNEFLFALVLTRDKVVPLSVGLIGFRTERGDLWEFIAATGIIITIPMFFFALAIQKHFTKGMTLGAVR